MMKYLTIDSELMCCHGGKVKLTSSSRSRIRDSGILTESDLCGATINGCPQVGPGVKPCTRVEEVLVGQARGIKSRASHSPLLLENVVAQTNSSPPGIASVVENSDSTAQILAGHPASKNDSTRDTLEDGPTEKHLKVKLRVDLSCLSPDPQRQKDLFFGPLHKRRIVIVLSVFQKPGKFFTRNYVIGPEDVELERVFPFWLSDAAESWVHIAPAGQVATTHELDPDYHPDQFLLAPTAERLQGHGDKPTRLHFNPESNVVQKLRPIVSATDGLNRNGLLRIHGFDPSLGFRDGENWHLFRTPARRPARSSNKVIVLSPKYPYLVKLQYYKDVLTTGFHQAMGNVHRMTASRRIELAQMCERLEQDKRQKSKLPLLGTDLGLSKYKFQWATIDVDKAWYEEELGFTPRFETASTEVVGLAALPVASEFRPFYLILQDALEGYIRKQTADIVQSLDELCDGIPLDRLGQEYRTVASRIPRSLVALDVAATYARVSQEAAASDPLIKTTLSNATINLSAEFVNVLTDGLNWLAELAPYAKGSPALRTTDDRWTELFDELLGLAQMSGSQDVPGGELDTGTAENNPLSLVWPPLSLVDVVLNRLEKVSDWRKVLSTVRKVEAIRKEKLGAKERLSGSAMTRKEAKKFWRLMERMAVFKGTPTRRNIRDHLKHSKVLKGKGWDHPEVNDALKKLQQLQSWRGIGSLRLFIAFSLLYVAIDDKLPESRFEVAKDFANAVTGLCEIAEIASIGWAKSLTNSANPVPNLKMARLLGGGRFLYPAVAIKGLGAGAGALDVAYGGYEFLQGHNSRGVMLIGSGVCTLLLLWPGIGWCAIVVLVADSLTFQILADYFRTSSLEKELVLILNRSEFSEKKFDNLTRKDLVIGNKLNGPFIWNYLEYHGIEYSYFSTNPDIGEASSAADAIADVARAIERDQWIFDMAWFPTAWRESEWQLQIGHDKTVPGAPVGTWNEKSLLVAYYPAIRIGYRLPQQGYIEESLDFADISQLGIQTLQVKLTVVVEEKTKIATCHIIIDGHRKAEPGAVPEGFREVDTESTTTLQELPAKVVLLGRKTQGTAIHSNLSLQAQAGKLINVILVSPVQAPHWQLRSTQRKGFDWYRDEPPVADFWLNPVSVRVLDEMTHEHDLSLVIQGCKSSKIADFGHRKGELGSKVVSWPAP